MTDRLSKVCEQALENYVRHLLHDDPALVDQLADFPFDAACFNGCNRVAIREFVTNGLGARQWYDAQKPDWSPRLPLDLAVIREYQRDFDNRLALLGCFARSLRLQFWPWWRHPSFVQYCCAVLASKHAPKRFRITDMHCA